MRKTRFVTLVILLLLLPFLAACAGPMGQRMTQGAILGGATGAALGGIAGGGKGAAVGGLAGLLIGGVGGAFVGVEEAKAAYSQPSPLPWLRRESGERAVVAVIPNPQFGASGMNVVQPVIEEQLMLRGADIDKAPYYAQQGQPAKVDYVVQVATLEQNGAVQVVLQVVNPSGRVVATGSDTRYLGYGSGAFGYYSGDYRVDAFQTAAKQAVWQMRSATPGEKPLATVPAPKVQ
ncbi:MAG: hypothetical protein HY473_00215 [Candidatus Sungbacteria bacterium]|uniref:Glycine zipper domain-containing protein n=1 Tax=Candidatus Sungiibacteriota bacterium TaxID=2750080 RepID=A0A932YWT2_9BACT|nr:hypothetical protein [Candidatus Sungbacteria bacterium]